MHRLDGRTLHATIMRIRGWMKNSNGLHLKLAFNSFWVLVACGTLFFFYFCSAEIFQICFSYCDGLDFGIHNLFGGDTCLLILWALPVIWWIMLISIIFAQAAGEALEFPHGILLGNELNLQMVISRESSNRSGEKFTSATHKCCHCSNGLLVYSNSLKFHEFPTQKSFLNGWEKKTNWKFSNEKLLV